MHFNFSAHGNTCWGSFLLYEWETASLVCRWKCCQVASKKSAYPGSALHLSTPWLLKHVLLSDMLCLPPWLPSPSFILLLHLSSLLGSPYVGQRWAVNGVLNRLWTGPTSPASIFCPHPSRRLFPLWLFLTPCAISLPDLHSISESVWLARQFHRTAHSKRAPREGGPDSLLLCSFSLWLLRGPYLNSGIWAVSWTPPRPWRMLHWWTHCHGLNLSMN